MEFKIGDKVKANYSTDNVTRKLVGWEGVIYEDDGSKVGRYYTYGIRNGEEIHCFDEGDLELLASTETNTDDQPEVKKIKKLEYKSGQTIYSNDLKNKINQLVDFCNAHNSKEERCPHMNPKGEFCVLCTPLMKEEVRSQCNNCFDGDHDKCSGGECKCREHKKRQPKEEKPKEECEYTECPCSNHFRKIDYSKLRDLAGKISGKDYEENPIDWEEQITQICNNYDMERISINAIIAIVNSLK